MDPSRQIDRLPSTQPDTIDPPRFDDEIDLVDLAVSLWQQKLVIAVFVVLGVLGSLVVAVLRPDSYEVSAVLTVGKVDGSDGSRLVQSTSTIVNWLESSILPAAAEIQATEFSLDPKDLKFRVSSSEGDAVVIRAETSEERVAAHVAAIDWAANRVTEAADKPIRDMKAELRTEIRTLELELDELKDADRLTSERLALQQKLVARQDALAKLLDQEKVLNEQRDRLARMKELRQARAVDIEAYLDQLSPDEASIMSASSPSDAMTAMLLSNQVQRYMDRLGVLNEEITVELPQKISQTQTDLAENKRQQEQLESEIEQARLALKTFNTDHERQIRKLQLAIENNKARLENIQTTGLLNEPQQRKADGVSGKLLIALGTILGLFLGLFAALMMNFISATRERLQTTALAAD